MLHRTWNNKFPNRTREVAGSRIQVGTWVQGGSFESSCVYCTWSFLELRLAFRNGKLYFFFHPRLFFQASNIVRSVIQFLRIINIFMTRPVVCMQLKPRFTRIHVQSLQKGWEDVISRRNVNIWVGWRPIFKCTSWDYETCSILSICKLYARGMWFNFALSESSMY